MIVLIMFIVGLVINLLFIFSVIFNVEFMNFGLSLYLSCKFLIYFEGIFLFDEICIV